MIRDIRFYPSFWTQFFGAFNDNVFKNALVILITYKSYSLGAIAPEQMVALCGAIFILPFFLFSSLAGQICDKYPKDKLIVKIKFTEVLVMLLGAYGLFTNNIALLVVTLFLMGAQSTFFGPIKYSILPEIIEEEELSQGNALFSMGTFLSILLGTILGGSLIAIDGLGAKVTAVAVVVFAVIGFYFSRKITVKKTERSGVKIDFNPITTTLKILGITKKNRDVYHSVLGISWYWLVGAILLSIFPVYAKDVLNADESVTTLFLGLFSVGVGIGAWLSGKISKTGIDFGLIILGSFGISLFSILLFFIPWDQTEEVLTIFSFLSHFKAYLISINLLCISIFSGLFIVPLYTLMQRDSEDTERSRVIAGNNILNALFMVIGTVILTLLYALKLNAQDVFVIIGLVNLVVFYCFYKKYSEYFWRLFCELCSRFFYNFSFEGEENVPKDGALILIGNHVSYIDWLFLAAATRRTPRFVMWYVFFKMPIISIFFKGAKAIPIAGAREDEKIMEHAFYEIDATLKANMSIGYFPEGFITADGKMLFFRPGLQKIVSETNATIVPMYLDGMWGSFFSRKYGKACTSFKALFTEFRRPVHVKIGEAFEFTSTDDAEKRVKELCK